VFILGVYVLGHWQMQLAMQRTADLLAIQKKVIDGIQEPPQQPAGHFWADLRQAGVVDDQDAATLRKYGYDYVPIGPDSPPDAVLFRQKQPDGHEKHVYADGTTGYEHTWPSPGGKHMLRDSRGPLGSKSRVVQFTRQPGDLAIGEFEIDGFQRRVLWSPGGQLVAMNASLTGRQDPFTLWHVGRDHVEPIALPPELTLDSLLSRETKFDDPNWGMHHIEAKRWLSPDELFVFAQGAGTFTDPVTKTKMGFNFIYHVVLEVQQGQCRFQSARKQHFAANPCTSCN
jgi:hypothetical protein